MSTMRGLIPSLGAGGSLIGAALCALAVLGGVFAFRGDSPGTAEADTGALKLPAGQVRAATEPGPRARPASVAAPRLVVVARRARSRRTATVATPRPGRAAPRVTAPTLAPSAPTTSAPTPSKPRPTTAPAEPPAVVPVGAVQRTVAQTRAAAKPVVDAAPAPVQHVADTVEQVAATVDGVAGALLP